MYCIETKQLYKTYKTGVNALQAIDIKVKQGEVFSLLGRNGAGKSTLINILTTFCIPTSGEVLLLGKTINKHHLFDIRSHIASVAQKNSIDEHLTLLENMKFQSRIYKIDREIAKQRINDLIDIFELQPYLHYPIANYSGGIKRRLDIAMNMIANPRILFLDEPTVGMDVFSRKAMWKCIEQIKQSFHTTIFLTTHYLEEAEFLSDTICIINQGKKLIQGSKEELAQYIKKQYIYIAIEERICLEKAIDILQNKYPKQHIIQKETQLLIDPNALSLQDIILLLLEHHITFSDVYIMKPSLEDIFLTITSKEEL